MTKDTDINPYFSKGAIQKLRHTTFKLNRKLSIFPYLPCKITKMKIIHSEMHKRRVPIIHIKAKSLHHFIFQTNYDKIEETMYNYMLATTISVYFTLFSVSSLARKTSLLSRSDNTFDVLYVVLIISSIQYRIIKFCACKMIYSDTEYLYC